MNKTTEALKYDILVLKIAARFLHKAVSAKERCDYWIVKELIAKKEMQLAEPVKQSLTMVAEPAIPEWVDVDDYEEPSVSDGVCGGCAKTAADGWALYCVECWEKAEPVKRPQNCGTGYCSCIECPYEPVSIPDHITCPFCESDHVPDWLHDLKLDAKAIRAEALEEAAKVAESVVAKQSKHINDGKPFYANMYWEEIAAAIRNLK